MDLFKQPQWPHLARFPPVPVSARAVKKCQLLIKLYPGRIETYDEIDEDIFDDIDFDSLFSDDN